MNALMLFGGSGPLVILTSHESATDPALLEKLKGKGLDKFIAYLYSFRGIVPSRQTVVVLQLGQTRSPGHELVNGSSHIKQRRTFAW